MLSAFACKPVATALSRHRLVSRPVTKIEFKINVGILGQTTA